MSDDDTRLHKLEIADEMQRKGIAARRLDTGEVLRHPRQVFEVNDPSVRFELTTEAVSERDRLVEQQVDWEFARQEAQDRVRTMRAGPRKPIALISDFDLLARPPVAHYVDDLLQVGTVALLAGAPGIGKTFLALDVALSVAYGQSCLGRDVVQGKVLYVAGEGARGFTSRTDAWRQSRGITLGGEFQFADEGVNLSDNASVDELVDLVRQHGFSLVIFDTFSQLSTVENENDAAQVAKVLRNARRVTEAAPDVSVIVVHHVNKASGNTRGSSVFEGNVDTLLIAKAHGSGFYVSTHREHGGKQKDGAPVRIDNLELLPFAGSAVVTIGGALTTRKDDAQQQILDLVAKHGSRSRKDLLIDLSKIHSRTTVDRVLDELKRSGALVVAARGVYELPALTQREFGLTA